MFLYLVVIDIDKVKRICCILNESKHQIFPSLVAETLEENLNKHIELRMSRCLQQLLAHWETV